MPALTIDAVEVHTVRWEVVPEHPSGDPSRGFDRTIRSGVTDARGPWTVIYFEGASEDRADAKTFEASLESGSVTLAGDLPGETLTARVQDLTPIEDPDVPLYGAVSCTFWVEPEEPV